MTPADPFDLNRFVDAQAETYDRALAEVSAGEKRSHWMWFNFPQLRGLGQSPTAIHYGLTGADEARAYLNHDVLGPRLIAICRETLNVPGRTAHQIFGNPDDMKLRSCATLFAAIAPEETIFQQILDKYFNGVADDRTLELLQQS